jgi:hypothetical protein
MKKISTLRFILSMLLIIMLIYGCIDDSHSIYEKPAIFVDLARYKDNSWYSNDSIKVFARANINGSHGVPIVTINDDTIHGYYSMIDSICYCILFGYISIAPQGEYELIVLHDFGEARAQVTMPSDFEITTPSNNDSLKFNEDLIINWDISNNAERYILDVHTEYITDIDSAERDDWIRFDSLINTTNTSITIPNERTFPSGSDTAQCGSGQIFIKSEYGPSIRHPLDTLERNITGDGVGYFVASNYTHCDENYIHIIIKNDSLTYPGGIVNETPQEFDGLVGREYGTSYFDSKVIILHIYDPKFTEFLE